ncbi:MAG: NAD-dependent succinate-semialdehyde dehydrogenase [Pseudomonadota bacterium]
MAEHPFLREQCYIAGEWIGASSGGSFDVNNPATGEIIGSAPDFGRRETAQAIDAAHAAIEGWRTRTPDERAHYCRALHDALMDHQEPLAELLTLEMGKPLAEAKGEIAYGAAFFQWFAEEARRIYGDVIPSPWTDKRIIVTKEPVGVVGAITPWNFPSAMIARKVAAALAAGCAVVSKPASETPFSALAFGVLADEIDLPKGVLNIITGAPAPIADEMCENPKTRKITFTGSTRVGKELASKATKHMKRISMELGGNAPLIIFDDADLDRAAEGAIACKFRNSGQTCVCANRIYVQAGIYDAFAERLTEKVNALTVGDGLKSNADQGPLINEKAVGKVEDHIADATEKGAKLVTGGKRHDLGQTYFEPTVLRDVSADMKIASEETFGPVAPLFKFETEAEVVKAANDTEYGLASYCYTNDLGRAWRMTEALQYGMVAINEGIISTPIAPFGGVKESGQGREGSKYGLDDYINVKYALFGGLGG